MLIYNVGFLEQASILTIIASPLFISVVLSLQPGAGSGFPRVSAEPSLEPSIWSPSSGEPGLPGAMAPEVAAFGSQGKKVGP